MLAVKNQNDTVCTISVIQEEKPLEGFQLHNIGGNPLVNSHLASFQLDNIDGPYSMLRGLLYLLFCSIIVYYWRNHENEMLC